MAQIEVSIKIRPLIGRETGESRLWVIPDENQIVQVDPHTKNHRGETYCFDHVFSERCSNKEVFGIVSKSIVEAAVNGFNGTIFAYGQTSSGKTHTMRGSSNDPGIIELAVEYLFELIGQKLDREFLLRVSYIEIYNETINDLLKRDNVNLKVKEEGGQVIIPSATEETETTIAGIIGLLERGENNRRIAETCMNDRSSRSHAIFRLIIESKGIDDAVQVSQLNLVDLAGSERTGLSGLTGSTFKEGIHINKSLTVLGKVIKDLSENPDGFINYRDSKLTRILQPALGGNALTAIICTVAPASADHTTSTLGFAQRAKKIKNKPKVNEVLTKDAHIKRMHLKMAELQAELDACKGSKTKEDDAFNAFNEEKLKHLQKLENMIINGTVGSHQTNTLKQKAKRRQTWCDTKSFKQVRKSVGELSSTTPSRNPAASQLWMLQSIQEQDSFASGSTEDNADFLSQYTADVFEEFVTSPPPENFGTPSAAIFSGFVTTQRGNGSRYHTNNVQTPPNLLRERADAYCQELQALQNITVKEKQINNEKLLEKLNQIDAENLKLKKELARWETSKFETEFEQEKKLEKAQKRAHELQSSLESAWSSQADIENQASILETENKALLSKIDLMSQTKRNISEKAIQTTQDDLGRSTDKNASVLLKDRLDRHKLALLNEIVAFNPKFEVDAPANSDEELLLKLLISTVTEKEQYFFSNLTESYDSKEKVLSNEVISLKQTIEKMKNEKTNFKENEDLRFQELSKDFESLLEEKQRTISQLEQNLVAAQARVLQISEHINKESSNELLVDKDEQITELQTNLLAANEASSLKSQLISDLEEKLFLKQNQLQEKIIHITDLETRLSTVADDSLQNSLFVIPNSEEQIDTKLSLNDEILKQYSQQITDLELKLLQMEEENLHKIEIINKFETKQEKMKNSMEENAKMMAELESCYGSQVNTLQAKLVEVEYLLQEKMETILDLEVKLSASSNEDSQEIVTEDRKETQNDAFKAKLTEMENLLEEKMLTIANLEENQSKLGNEETQQNQVVILQAKLAAMGIRLQEEMLTIAELESMRPRNVLEDSQEYLSAKLKVKIRELENKLQEKLLSIANLESKLSEFSTEDSQVAWVDTQAKLMEVESLLQKKVLIIKDLESKLSEESTEDSQDPRTDILQAKLMEVENLLHEKVHVITELESKLSEVSTEDSQDARTDILQAKLMEVENLLQEKMHVITELESKLSEVSTEDSQDPRTDILQAKLMEVENLLQEKVHVITELESKLSEVSTEDSQDSRTDILQAKLMEVENLLQEKMHAITELESKLSEVSTEDSQDARTDTLQAKLMEVEGLLQEKVLFINELESKLAEINTTDSQDARVDTLQAECMQVENLPQENVLIIKELESKLAETSNEDSRDVRMDALQAKLMQLESLLHEKVSIITELESKLSAVSTEDSQDARGVDTLQAKLMEVESLLQDKVFIIDELESKLSAVSTEDSQDARGVDTLQAKLMEVESLLQEKALNITELESKLAELSSKDQGTLMKTVKVKEEISYQETMMNISEMDLKLSEANQYDNSSPGKSWKLGDTGVKLDNIHEESSSFTQPSPTFLESLENIMGMHSELSPCRQNRIPNVSGGSESDITELKSAFVSIQHTRVEDTELRAKVVAPLETSDCETQTEIITLDQSIATDVYEVSDEDKNIIHVLENQLEKIRNELVCKVDEIQSMQTLLSDKCLTFEALKVSYSKIDSEFKSFAENSVVVINKLQGVESELDSKLKFIALLETKLHENSRTTENLKENLICCDVNFNKNVEKISLLEDQLIQVKASLKATQEENESLQKALFEKALHAEDLEGKCSEQEARFREQSTRFQLLEDKLHQVKADFKKSLDNVCSLQDDLKEKSMFIKELQSHSSDVDEKLQLCSNEIQDLKGELIRKSSLIESLESKTKTSVAHLKESLETIRSLEEDRKKQIMEIENGQEKLENLEIAKMNMKKAQENDQFTIQCLKEKMDSMKKELNEKLSTIEDMSIKIDSLHKSLAEKMVVVQTLTEKSDCSENELSVKLNEIKLLNSQIEKQNKALSENTLAIQNMEEKLASYEKDLKDKLERIKETNDRMDRQRMLLEDRVNLIQNLEKSLATRPYKDDLEKQSAVIRTLQLQLAAREESIKENSESTNAAKELQDQVLNLKRKNHDMAETNQELIEKLEAAKRQNEDLDKENDNLNCLWLETDKFAKETESELEAEIEKLKAELELARSSLDAAKEDKELLNTKVAKYQSLQSDLTNREKELLTLQTQNKTLKENVELSMHSKQLLEKELESLKRSPCECKSLKNRVKVLLKDLEKTNLELVQRNGEFAGLELQIMKEEFPHKNAAEQLRKENAEMKDMIKTLKTELRRMEAAAPNETKNACQVCLGKPRATESPLRMVPTNSTKLQENRSEDLERVLAALQEKNQLYKKIAHDRMQYIVKLEKEKETLVPGFKSRYVVNKENK